MRLLCFLTEHTPEIHTPTVALTPEPSATPTSTPVPTPTPVPEEVFIPLNEKRTQVYFTGEEKSLLVAGIGDTVKLGRYEQDNDLSNGAEEIEWLVLDNQDNQLFLISKYCLDVKPFQEEGSNLTWTESSLRTWLNQEFYQTAFSEEDKKLIWKTKVTGDMDRKYNSKLGEDTEDKVFLLGVSQSFFYFEDSKIAYDVNRRGKLTAYAIAQGGWIDERQGEYYGNGRWWLSLPSDGGIVCMQPTGSFEFRGYSANDKSTAVRPVIWVRRTTDSTSALPTPTPVPVVFTPQNTGSKVSFTGKVSTITEAKVGDTVRFGSYEQDGDSSNGAEEIEWLVLDAQDGNLFLLSKHVLDNKKYHEKKEDIIWKSSTLRTWLNHDFVSAAFSEEEQGRILLTYVNNSNDKYTGDMSGADTNDKVFLLSIEEARTYFDEDENATDENRYGTVTEYARQQGCYVVPAKGNTNRCGWFLRSAGHTSGSFTLGNQLVGYVPWDGTVKFVSEDFELGIRPVIWIQQ